MTKSTNPLSQTKLNEAILIITNTESISDNWEERKEGKKKQLKLDLAIILVLVIYIVLFLLRLSSRWVSFLRPKSVL